VASVDEKTTADASLELAPSKVVTEPEQIPADSKVVQAESKPETENKPEQIPVDAKPADETPAKPDETQ
jgi:hypothetical protein